MWSLSGGFDNNTMSDLYTASQKNTHFRFDGALIRYAPQLVVNPSRMTLIA